MPDRQSVLVDVSPNTWLPLPGRRGHVTQIFSVFEKNQGVRCTTVVGVFLENGVCLQCGPWFCLCFFHICLLANDFQIHIFYLAPHQHIGLQHRQQHGGPWAPRRPWPWSVRPSVRGWVAGIWVSRPLPSSRESLPGRSLLGLSYPDRARPVRLFALKTPNWWPGTVPGPWVLAAKPMGFHRMFPNKRLQ